MLQFSFAYTLCLGINNSTILRPFLKVGIEATAGSGYRRDIAIDDIVITDHPCRKSMLLSQLKLLLWKMFNFSSTTGSQDASQ